MRVYWVTITILWFVFALLCTYSFGADYYVDAVNGDNRNGGVSEQTAWKTITYALAEVVVAPTDLATIHVAPGTYSASTNGETFPLEMRSYVSLVGAGTAATILDGEQIAHHVVFFSDVTDATIRGFTITGGNADGQEDEGRGAAIYCLRSSPAIEQNAVTGNSTRYGNGGAIYCLDSSPTIADGTISGNGPGGGMYCEGGSPFIIGNFIEGNAGAWGAIESSSSSLTVKDSVMQYNDSGNSGGAIATGGGALDIVNCLMVGNYAGWGWGGAIACWGTSLSMTNCTFVGNHANGEASQVVVLCRDGSGIASNCVWWDNWDDPMWGCAANHCCFEEESGLGEGNIFADPLFISGPLGDYYLSCKAAGQVADSPCIDRGTGTAKSLSLDRFTTRTDHTPDSGIADMGYHYSLPKAGPWIECSLNEDRFAPGEQLVSSVQIDNNGPAIVVDVYAGFILPDGSILCYTGDGFVLGVTPWLESVTLPPDLHFGPAEPFQLTIPGDVPPGRYALAAALSKPGDLDVVGWPSLYLFKVLPPYGTEYEVNWDGTGDFTHIQDAIDAAADGDIITVYPGTYFENLYFRGKNITLRSLDPEDEEIVASTIIDGGQKGSVVTFAGTEDETCQLTGFTIWNGRSNGDGGGVHGRGNGLDSARAVLTRCMIMLNLAGGNYGKGGGLYACDGAISHCTISGNTAESAGGGLYCCNGEITNCVITNNSAYAGGGLLGCDGPVTECAISDNSAYSEGGGLSNCGGPISNCTITGNSVNSGGGLYACHGPISNCTISGNWAINGGGLDWCVGPITNCTITGNSAYQGRGLLSCYGTISNCTISGNSADEDGGGLLGCDAPITNCAITDNSAEDGGGLSQCDGAITNCTICDNSAQHEGGGLYWGASTIVNTIIWGNQAASGDELVGRREAPIIHCCIQGGYEGEGNIHDDPLFVPGPLGEYYLHPESPCIDTGSQSAADAGLSNRTTQADGTPDTGTVDMGFHYRVPAQ